jgi:S-disulfanyl-L-cysteine oxidoreductase SoxD
MRADLRLSALVLATVALPALSAARYGFGRTPTPAEIAALDIDVRPDGQGLPAGHGSAHDGAQIFATTCAACHGAKGEKAGIGPLAGGFGTLTAAKPVKTIGSYWPYATSLFDYIRRAMPFNAPESLTDDQVYAVTAYVLSLNKIVPDGAVLDAQSLPKIKMPNRDGFHPADWKNNRPFAP